MLNNFKIIFSGKVLWRYPMADSVADLWYLVGIWGKWCHPTGDWEHKSSLCDSYKLTILCLQFQGTPKPKYQYSQSWNLPILMKSEGLSIFTYLCYYCQTRKFKGPWNCGTFSQRWPGQDFWRPTGNWPWKFRCSLLCPESHLSWSCCHQENVVLGKTKFGKMARYSERDQIFTST